MPEDQNYTLTVTRHQAGVIQDALEAYARLRMGQINTVITDAFLDRYANKEYPGFTYDVVQQLCGELKKQIFPELFPGAYYGVGAKVYPERDVAWDVHSVIRHRLAWDRLADEGKEKPDFYGVQYNQPMRFSGEPLAIFKRHEARGEINA